MANSIIDLEKERTNSTRLYNRTQEIVDGQTGEIKTIVTSFLQKEQTKDAFIKVFVENLDFLVENLSNNARTVFLVMIKNVNYKNIFKYDSDFVKYFEEKKILAKSSVYRALKELEDKQAVFKIDESDKDKFDIIGKNSYILNPQIVGKGSIKDLKQLRQTTVKTFNFETLEMKKEILTDATYDGFEKVLEAPDSFQIDSVKEIEHSKNKSETEIVISKKQDDELIDAEYKSEPSLFDEQSMPKESPAADAKTESDIAAIMQFVGEFKGDFKGDAKQLRTTHAQKYDQRTQI
ncbi:hypothetical protein U5B43_09855 [Campylobacter sp. 9BO]|uniref:hypothetical protein n=1 Tax=Campylobacter sp. 9BO TaxID=3424759 RepID=UPI003D32817E